MHACVHSSNSARGRDRDRDSDLRLRDRVSETAGDSDCVCERDATHPPPGPWLPRRTGPSLSLGTRMLWSNSLCDLARSSSDALRPIARVSRRPCRTSVSCPPQPPNPPPQASGPQSHPAPPVSAVGCSHPLHTSAEVAYLLHTSAEDSSLASARRGGGEALSTERAERAARVRPRVCRRQSAPWD